jgi:hypothetical protein
VFREDRADNGFINLGMWIKIQEATLVITCPWANYSYGLSELPFLIGKIDVNEAM